jgi:hypothetical protein
MRTHPAYRRTAALHYLQLRFPRALVTSCHLAVMAPRRLASAIITHASEIILRTLAVRAAQLSLEPAFAAEPVNLHEAPVRGCY